MSRVPPGCYNQVYEWGLKAIPKYPTADQRAVRSVKGVKQCVRYRESS